MGLCPLKTHTAATLPLPVLFHFLLVLQSCLFPQVLGRQCSSFRHLSVVIALYYGCFPLIKGYIVLQLLIRTKVREVCNFQLYVTCRLRRISSTIFIRYGGSCGNRFCFSHLCNPELLRYDILQQSVVLTNPRLGLWARLIRFH